MVALADTEGSVTFQINPLNDGGGGLQPSRTGVTDGYRRYSLAEIERMGFKELETTVTAVKLDSWLERPSIRKFVGPDRAVSLVKCDVEGGELGVLHGAMSLLEGTPGGSHPAWIVEVSLNVDDVFQIFDDAGYLSFESTLGGLRATTASTSKLGANVLFIHREDERLEKVVSDRRTAFSNK